jgi:membrane protein DedA with SNARE-associated domain
MLDFVTQFLEQFAYVGLVGILLAAGLGVPIPEDIPLMVGGLLSAQGVTNVYVVFGLAYASILVGDFMIFSAGRRLGPAALKKPWALKLLTHRRQRVITRYFKKWGPLTIVAARHMAGLRAPCFLMAGVARMNPIWFILADGFGACLSVPLFIFIGYKFGENLDAIIAYVKEAQRGLMVLGIILAVALLVARHLFLRRTRAERHVTNHLAADAARRLREEKRARKQLARQGTALPVAPVAPPVVGQEKTP